MTPEDVGTELDIAASKGFEEWWRINSRGDGVGSITYWRAMAAFLYGTKSGITYAHAESVEASKAAYHTGYIDGVNATRDVAAKKKAVTA